MPWEDPIVEDVRKVRDSYARRFNYDLDAIYRDLKEKEQRGGRTVVCGPGKGRSEDPSDPLRNSRSVG